MSFDLEIHELWGEVLKRHFLKEGDKASLHLLQLLMLNDPGWEEWYFHRSRYSMKAWQVEQLQKLLGPHGKVFMKVLKLKWEGKL